MVGVKRGALPHNPYHLWWARELNLPLTRCILKKVGAASRLGSTAELTLLTGPDEPAQEHEVGVLALSFIMGRVEIPPLPVVSGRAGSGVIRVGELSLPLISYST